MRDLSEYKNFNLSDTRAILERIKSSYGFEGASDVVFAKKANLNVSSLAGWITRNSIPFNLLLSAALDNKISLDYLVFGAETNTSVSQTGNKSNAFVIGNVLNSNIVNNSDQEILKRIHNIEAELFEMRASLLEKKHL